MNSTHDFQTASAHVNSEPNLSRVTGIKNIDSPLEALVFFQVNKKPYAELRLHELFPVNLEDGSTFNVQLSGTDGIPTTALPFLLQNGKLVVDGKSTWRIIEQQGNRYKIQFGNHNKKILTKLLFSNEEMETVKIILVGTVPTCPGDGDELRTDLSIENIHDVELTFTGNTSIVSFTTPPGRMSRSILLDSKKPMPMGEVIEYGQVFTISFKVDSFQKFMSVNLLLEDGNVVLEPSEGDWSADGNIFTFGKPGSRPTFRLNLMLYPDSATEAIEIILVGTVPTLPGGEK